MKIKQNILCIPDLHAPFSNIKAVEEMIYQSKYHNLSHIVQIGDAYDLYSFSRFARSVNILTPQQEITEGKNYLTELWRKLQKNCPKVKCYQLRGNHSDRIMKRLYEKVPEFESVVITSIRDLLHFYKVHTLISSKDHLRLNDIIFHHGWRTQLGVHARHFGQNTVVGHSHKGGVYYEGYDNKSIWELNCGHLADTTQIPLQYNESKYSKWTLGYGLVDKFGPRFITL